MAPSLPSLCGKRPVPKGLRLVTRRGKPVTLGLQQSSQPRGRQVEGFSYTYSKRKDVCQAALVRYVTGGRWGDVGQSSITRNAGNLMVLRIMATPWCNG